VTRAVPQSEVDCEIVSVALFGRAHEAGIPITRRWVNEQLARLGTHPDGCRCSEACGEIARSMSARSVTWTATTWQRQYGRSLVAARR
jgi:hypothetical protein